MSTVTCPYCEEELEVDHDCGLNYEEDEENEMECSSCEKNFIVRTSVSYFHEGVKAPCLNGGEHKWIDINGIPKEVVEGTQVCDYCGKKRDLLTAEERKFKINKYLDNLSK